MSYGVKLYYTQCTVQPDRKRPPGVRIAASCKSQGSFFSPYFQNRCVCFRLGSSCGSQCVFIVFKAATTKRRSTLRCHFRALVLEFASVNQSVQKWHRTAETKWNSLLTGHTRSLPAALFTPTTTHTRLAKNALTKNSLFCFMI